MLGANGLKINCTKIEYLIFNFYPKTQETPSLMTIEDVQISKCEAFRYLKVIIQRNN